MDYFLLIPAILFIVLGIAGCLLPIIPGPPLSLISLVLLHFTRWGEFETKFFIIFGTLTLLVTLLDYLLPVWVTKKTGSTKAGVWGAMIGLLIGIFILPPIGIIIGPFIGALIGELIIGAETNKAIRAGLGAFFGFLMGTGLKLIISFIMTWYFITELFW